LLSNKLASLYGSQNIVSVSLNPGNVGVEWFMAERTLQIRLLRTFIFYPIPMGAITPLWAGTSAEGKNMNGKVRFR